MTFLEDLSHCCSTTLVGTFVLMSDTPFAAVEASHFYTVHPEHKRNCDSSPLHSHFYTAEGFCLPSSPSVCLA